MVCQPWAADNWRAKQSSVTPPRSTLPSLSPFSSLTVHTQSLFSLPSLPLQGQPFQQPRNSAESPSTLKFFFQVFFGSLGLSGREKEEDSGRERILREKREGADSEFLSLRRTTSLSLQAHARLSDIKYLVRRRSCHIRTAVSPLCTCSPSDWQYSCLQCARLSHGVSVGLQLD